MVAMLLLSPYAQAQAPGAMVEGSLAVGNKVLPLPPGSWRVLHLGVDDLRTSDMMVPTRVHQAVLVQERAGRAAAVIVAQAAQEIGVHWEPHGICLNEGAIARRVASAVRAALDCRGLVVVAGGRQPGLPGYLAALYDEGQRRAGWLPPYWISSQFLISETMHYLNVEYRVAPSASMSAATGGVTLTEGARVSLPQALVDQLDGWGARAHAELRRGLYGRQPATPLPAPF
ncbi:hypothetical protein [Falsiroseomonas stagni]|nr:hypothetical protein [Falsiroseomonas stagni]